MGKLGKSRSLLKGMLKSSLIDEKFHYRRFLSLQMQFTQYQLVPKFTSQGFDIIKIPDHVYQKLRGIVDDAVDNWDELPYEGMKA